MAEKVNLKTLTIGQTLDIVDEQKPRRKLKSGKLTDSATSSFRNRLDRIGISLDTPYKKFGDKDFLESIAEGKFSIDEKTGSKKAVGDPYAKLVTFHNELEKYASSTNQKLDYENFGDKAVRSGIITAKQSRGTAVFEGVMEAKVSLPAIAQTIAQIEDPETRSAVAFNALVPLRAEAVVSLNLDEVDLETGYMIAVREGQKKRPKLKLTGVALELLRDQAEIAKEAGRTTFFDTNSSRMTAAIKAPGGLQDLMRPYADEMGREISGVKDLRKIVPSVVAFELGYEAEASEILGHKNASQTIGTLEKMSSDHYVSRIIRLGEEPRATVALRAIQNMYGETMGLQTLNELPAALNISAKGIELSNEAIPIVREEGDILEAKEPRQLTADDKKLIEDRRRLASKQVAAQTAEADAAEQAARTRAQEERLKQAELTPEQEKKLARQRLAKREATKQVQAEDKAAQEAVEKEENKKKARGFVKGLLDMVGPIADKGMKALPFAAAAPVAGEAIGAAEAGEYGLAARRGVQAMEELISPLPVTTRDIEEVKPVEPQYGERGLGEVLQRGLEKTGRSISEQTSELFDRN